jgi:hypothetical protein
MSQLTVASTGMKAKVELDGQDISSALRGLSVRYDAQEIPTAVLDVMVHHAGEISADGVHVVIPAATADLLVQLGWTPPPSGHLNNQKGAEG